LRKKLLFVTDVFPFPLDRGQHVRIQNVLAACGKAFDVTFLGPAPVNRVDRDEVEQHCARSKYLNGAPTEWAARLSLAARTARATLTVPRPATIRKYAPFVAAIRELAPENFDFVWAERPHIARVCEPFIRRTILDLDDIEHVKIARLLSIQKPGRGRMHNMYRYRVYRHLELSWSRRFLASVVCSEEDRAYLERHGCRNAVTVPNGPNLARPWHIPPRPRRVDPTTPIRVVFLGNVDSKPNIDAIRFFNDEVLPALLEKSPEAVFDVIGPGASTTVDPRFGSRVRFRGFVEDLGAALSEYDVLVAPLRFGGGTKLKVLDAMAHGIPVVTTSVGAEGLSITHGEHALLAETAAEIAEGILRVKQDEALANRLATNAFALVRDRFSWDAIRDRLTEWLQRLEAPA
jgi:glycosyltransferase involved in cell wall biosynthesis